MSQHVIDGSMGFLLSKGTQSLHRELNRNFQRNKLDITYEQWSVLIFLFHFDGKSQNEIAEQTHRDKVSVTKIIDNLEKNDLVRRAPDEKDRRVNRIFLTDVGKEVIPSLRKIAIETLTNAFNGIKKSEIKTFKKVLSVISKNTTGEDLLKFVKINEGRWK